MPASPSVGSSSSSTYLHANVADVPAGQTRQSLSLSFIPFTQLLSIGSCSWTVPRAYPGVTEHIQRDLLRFGNRTVR